MTTQGSGAGAEQWIEEATATARTNPGRVARLFAEAGRKVGREPLDPDDPHGYHGTVDDDARAAIIAALAESGAPARVLPDLYEHGDDAERRGVLRGLQRVSGTPGLTEEWREAGLTLTADALRTNDPRLVAAAMGDFARDHLDDHAWRHGVLKLVFMGAPLAVVSGLENRRDAELADMADRFAAERQAAGRSIPDDLRLIDARA